eukprot:5275498-Pyramimonas_sp.AAC.1
MLKISVPACTAGARPVRLIAVAKSLCHRWKSSARRTPVHPRPSGAGLKMNSPPVICSCS